MVRIARIWVGEEHELAFSLIASTHPITYHGKLVNVDHYVRVQMDVPWAFNPKSEEEYLLKPGEPPEGFAGSRDEPIILEQNKAASSIVGKFILFMVLGVILATVSVFAIFVLPIPLIVAGFFWIRSGTKSRCSFQRNADAGRIGFRRLYTGVSGDGGLQP